LKSFRVKNIPRGSRTKIKRFKENITSIKDLVEDELEGGFKKERFLSAMEIHRENKY
jgi:hypothetical protein